LGKTICNDGDIVDNNNIIRPKDVKALLAALYAGFVKAGMFTNEAAAEASIQVQINSSNPNRIDQSLQYYRTGVGRILSTTNYANFNYGQN
jgi:phage tail sheath gpL-like